MKSTRTAAAGGGAHRRDPRAEIIGEEGDEGRFGRPTLDAAQFDLGASCGASWGAGCGAGRLDARSAPREVVADRERREVRCEHQPDDHFGAGLDRRARHRFDPRIGVLHPEHDVERARCALVERGLDRVALRGGERGERRDPSDRGVAGGEVGERLRRRRPTAADVGVVRLDLARGDAACRTPSGRR